MLVFFLQGCKEDDPLDIPVPENDVEVSIERLDSAFFDLSAVTFRRLHSRWQADYEELYKRYIEDILQLGSMEDSNLFAEVRAFTTDPTMLEVKAKIDEVFPNISPYEQSLSEAWKYYHYYFPNRIIPNHLTFNGGFNTPAALTPNGVGIGLELYLGEDCVFYDYLQLPVYLRSRMTPDHLVPTVMKGWIETEFPLEEVTPTLLQTIIAQGKVLYCLDALLPRTADAKKIFYTEEEVQWAQEHAPYVWAHFIDNDLLFTTDQSEIAKFCNEGPFTVDLVKESPSRMGHFIGWQIVRAYMKRQEKIDLEALMATDAETILNQSKYKP